MKSNVLINIWTIPLKNTFFKRSLAPAVKLKAILAYLCVVFSVVVSSDLQAKPEYRGPGRYVNSDHSDHSYHQRSHHKSGHHKRSHHKSNHHKSNHHKSNYSKRSQHSSANQSHVRQSEAIDYAKVVNVQPLSRTVRVSTPQTECWQEKVTYRSRRSDSSTGAILGGIIGAAVGNELGHHDSNKKVGAVAGALLGSSIGKDISKQNGRSRTHTGVEEKCRSYETYHDENRIDGYLVEYRYQGNFYTTRMQSPPGDRLKVRVHVSPII